MTHTFKLSRRAARFRAPVLATLLALAFGACDADELTNTTSEDLSAPAALTDATAFAAGEAPSSEISFRGGIPFGTFAQPTIAFGDQFNGGMVNHAPELLLKELAGVKARGGKVVLMFAGNERHYKTNGYFDLGKWKSRINRFKPINFTPFINDGTIVGHYMIDEPNDPANWHGRPISPAVLEEMAKYSKQLWPGLTTIVRVEPKYLSSSHRYLDAAWGQYAQRKGPAADFMRRNTADAQKRGLGLVLGLNLIKGGRNGGQMTASEVKEWGSALLNTSYPCAFISWNYNTRFLSSSSMKDAMRMLRGKAQSRGTKTCRG